MKRGLIIVLLLCCCGCVFDHPYEEPQSGHKISFTLVGFPGELSGTTRAPGEGNENQISRIDLFFFDKSGVCLFYPNDQQLIRNGTKITAVIPETTVAGMLDVPLDLYILANCELPSDQLRGNRLEELQQLIQENHISFNTASFADNGEFLMDGSLEIIVPSEGSADLGAIQLRRAAAKVVVSISQAHIDGYIATEAYVRLNNYLDKTSLGSGAQMYAPQANDYNHADYRPIALPGVSSHVPGPFYSYSNDWEFDSSGESYITLAVKWQKLDPGGDQARMYYYRIPFNYIPNPSGDGNRYRLRRNYVYTFEVNVSELGGLDPEEMVELRAGIELKDWTTNEIEVELNQYDYLVVAEKFIEMHDIDHYEVHYNSSKPITVNIDSAYYYQYEFNGDIIKTDWQSGSYYPQVSIDEADNTIHIDCQVPNNYVPVYMQFTVINEAGLKQVIRAVQYPRQYMTSARSTGPRPGEYPEGGWSTRPGFNNYNFYTITTTSINPSDDFVIGGGMVETEYDRNMEVWRTDTKTDVATNNMVSPQFVIATQYGITGSGTSRSAAHYRCSTYSEGPYPVGTWRIPTQAEMLLISKLQRDENSALKSLFKNGSDASDTWWCATITNYYFSEWDYGEYYHCVRMETGEVVQRKRTLSGSGEPIPGSSVRCVHDVWKDK